jgi:hypothetical protein
MTHVYRIKVEYSPPSLGGASTRNFEDIFRGTPDEVGKLITDTLSTMGTSRVDYIEVQRYGQDVADLSQQG